MGETAAETLSEIEASRARLANDLDVLDRRLPEGDELVRQAKLYGGAAAGGLLALVAMGLLGKRRMTKRGYRKEARRQAEALAEVLEDGLVLTPKVTHETRSGSAGPIALAAAAAALGLSVVTYLQQRGASGGGAESLGNGRLD